LEGKNLVNQQKLFEDEPKKEEPEIKQVTSKPELIVTIKEDEGDLEHYCVDCKKNFKYSSNDIRPYVYCKCDRGYKNPNLKNTKN